MSATRPRILNKRHPITCEAVYVGRPTKWGNPFVIGKDGTRVEVIEKYRAWLFSSGLINSIAELRGQNLVCWCAPKLCHADILLEFANK